MRSRTLVRTRNDAAWIAAMAFALLILAAGPSLAGYSPRGVADMLYSEGYYNIRIDDSDRDEYEVVACKGSWLYEIEINRNGRIGDIDREGRCHPRHYGGYYAGDVHVSAPFTGVRVGERGVRVRAPFVDLYVPRR